MISQLIPTFLHPSFLLLVDEIINYMLVLVSASCSEIHTLTAVLCHLYDVVILIIRGGIADDEGLELLSN